MSTTVNILCVFGSKMLRPPSCQHFLFSGTEAGRHGSRGRVTGCNTKWTKGEFCSVDLPSAKKKNLPSRPESTCDYMSEESNCQRAATRHLCLNRFHQRVGLKAGWGRSLGLFDNTAMRFSYQNTVGTHLFS